MRKLVAGRLAIIRRGGEERGAALVAAIGVMIIALSLGALVISQAIVSQRDSGRNRARTVEIHAAEGGVDSLYMRLKQGNFVCHWATTAEDSLGPDAVGAEATVRYWDATDNEMDCSGDTLVWDSHDPPARARILVTSENDNASMAGIEPVRSFESEVLLDRDVIAGEGAAVFSADGIMTTNGASVTTLNESSGTANIWVDKGSVDCNSSFTAEGSLFIPDGNLKMSSNCNIKGDAWVSGSAALDQAPARIGGDLWSKSGPVTMESGTSVGGTVNTEGTFTCRGCSTNDDNAGEPIEVFHQSRGLPEVTYSPADWQGFVERDYYEVVRQSAVNNDAFDYNAVAKSPAGRQHQCNQLDGSSWSLNGPLRLPENASVLDARDCDIHIGTLDVTLRSDTVIFAKKIRIDKLNVRSEGGDHALWLIVPDPVKNGTAECRDGIGNIKVNVDMATRPDASVFMYTPCTIDLNNDGAFYGQLYGNSVELRNRIHLIYMPLGIPGVDLLPGYVDASGGWNVDVVYKRETGDRVG